MPEFVAIIGEEKYATLQAAVEAANGLTTISLIADTKENVTIPEGKEIILDLNGFTLSGGTDSEPEHKDKPAILNNGTITIKDSKEGGMVRRDDTSPDSYYVIDNQGIMTIESGHIYNNSGSTDPEVKGGSSLIRNGGGNGELAPDYAKLYIKGGKLEQDNFIAVKNDDSGYVAMTGGEVKSANESALQNWSNADVSGGTINGLVWALTYDPAYSKSETNFSGDATVNGKIWAENYDTEKGTKPANVNITGGNYHLATSQTPKDGPAFRVKKGADISVVGGNFDIDPTDFKVEDVNAGGKFEISGGAFNVDPAPYMDPSMELDVNPDGSYHVVGTGVDIVDGTSDDPNMQNPIDPMHKYDPNKPVIPYPVQPSELPAVTIAIYAKYPTRKAYEKVIFDTNFIDILDVVVPRRITALLDTCHVALVVDGKYYPVDETNYEEQFALVKAGKAPTVNVDENFGVKKLECFAKSSETENAKKIMEVSDIYSGFAYGTCIMINDFNKIGIEAVNANGYWMVFDFDLAGAEAEGYSEITMFDGTAVVQSDNFINVTNEVPMGVFAKYTDKEGNVHNVKMNFKNKLMKRAIEM